VADLKGGSQNKDHNDIQSVWQKNSCHKPKNGSHYQFLADSRAAKYAFVVVLLRYVWVKSYSVSTPHTCQPTFVSLKLYS